MPPRFFGDDSPDWPAPAAPDTPRIALVVGNGAYRQSRLDNPTRDARLIAQLLDRLGFDTEVVLDGGKAVLETAIVRLGERLDKAGSGAIGFFYFAGHGIQHLGTNYLVPVDAQIPDTRYLKSGAIMVDYLVEELARTPSVANVIVLDACRDNAVRDSGGGLTQGLASIRDLPDGTLVAFSTAAGKVAEDGAGEHSPYATALARRLDEPGRRIEEIFFDVSRDVAEATRNSQRPALFVQGAIPAIFLKPGAAGAPETATPPPLPEVETPQAMAPAAETRATPMQPVLGFAALPPKAEPAVAAPRRSATKTLLAGAAAACLLAATALGYLFWPRPVAIDLAEPASWPLQPNQALVVRKAPGRPCEAGWTGVADGLYCLRASAALGPIWDAGHVVQPLAAAMLLTVSARGGERCAAPALFEAEHHCLGATSPVPEGRQTVVSRREAEVVGAPAGTARIGPRGDTCGGQTVGSGHCLIEGERFGSLEPTPLGRERLPAAPGAAAVSLSAYQRVGACPRPTTVLENERFCLVMMMW